MPLQPQLDELKAAFLSKAPEDAKAVMAQTNEELLRSGIADRAPQAGQTLRDFELPNQNGKTLRLADLREQGPVVVAFYRGGWCPYCNLELKALQDALPQIEAAGARLVAITPELPDASLTTVQKNELSFDVLSDEGAAYARSLGMVFTLPEVLRPIYSGFGIDVEAHNGAGNFDLPLAATFVVDARGKIVFASGGSDYTKRAEPSEVVEAVRALG